MNLRRRKTFNTAEWILLIACGVLLVLIFMPERMVTRDDRETAKRADCALRLEKLAQICGKYAADHNGRFPEATKTQPNTAQMLYDEGYLVDPESVSCLSSHIRFPRSAFFFVSGVDRSMSPKMPCVIERMTNHDRMIGVVYVDGTTAQLVHSCADYGSLIRSFTGLKPAEQEHLRKYLKRLDVL